MPVIGAHRTGDETWPITDLCSATHPVLLPLGWRSTPDWHARQRHAAGLISLSAYSWDLPGFVRTATRSCHRRTGWGLAHRIVALPHCPSHEQSTCGGGTGLSPTRTSSTGTPALVAQPARAPYWRKSAITGCYGTQDRARPVRPDHLGAATPPLIPCCRAAPQQGRQFSQATDGGNWLMFQTVKHRSRRGLASFKPQFE